MMSPNSIMNAHFHNNHNKLHNDAFLREKTYHKQQFTIYNYYNGM